MLGRTNRPYIKDYDQETNLRCMLLLDGSASMGYGGRGVSKYEYAQKLVAALAYLMLGNTEHVGLGIFSKELEQWVSPRSGTGQLAHLMELLERTSPRGPSDHARAMHQAAERLGRRSLVVLVSDCFAPAEAVREGLAHFSHDRHEAIVLRVLDRDEIEFPFRSWHRFRGLEGEAAQICEPAVVRTTYLRQFANHAQQLQNDCRSLKIEFKTFVTDEPLADSLTPFLTGRR